MLCAQKRCYVTGGLHAAHLTGWVALSMKTFDKHLVVSIAFT